MPARSFIGCSCCPGKLEACGGTDSASQESLESCETFTPTTGKYVDDGPRLMPVYLAMAQGSSNYKVDVSLKVELLDGTHRSKNFRAVLDTGAAPVIV